MQSKIKIKKSKVLGYQLSILQRSENIYLDTSNYNKNDYL